MSDSPILDFTGVPVYVDGANMAFPESRAKGQPPSARLLFEVLGSLKDRLPGARIITLVDHNVWGWLYSKANKKEKQKLEQRQRDDLLSVTPAHASADPVLLLAARAASGIVVSNDKFDKTAAQRERRVGVPILRVAMPPGCPPIPLPAFQIHATAHAGQPERLTDADVLARLGRPADTGPGVVPPSAADGVEGAPEGKLTIDRLIRWLLAHLGDDEALDRDIAGARAGQYFGPSFAGLLSAEVGGRKQGRWARLCRRLPGWQVEVDAQGRRWLVPVADDSVEAAGEPEPGATFTIEDFRSAFDELAGAAQRVNLDRAASLIALPLGDDWHGFLERAVGGAKIGRFTRLCEAHLPGWVIREVDGIRWLMRGPSHEPEADPRLGDLLEQLDALIAEDEAMEIGHAASFLAERFGADWKDFLAEVVGGPKQGRWMRLCARLPGWCLERDADGSRFLTRAEDDTDDPAVPEPDDAGLYTRAADDDFIDGPEDFLERLWDVFDADEIQAGVTIATVVRRYREAGYHWDQAAWRPKKLTSALRSAASGTGFTVEPDMLRHP